MSYSQFDNNPTPQNKNSKLINAWVKLNNFLQEEGDEEETNKQVMTQSAKRGNKSRPMSSAVTRGNHQTVNRP